jgi:hypothetical protein
MELIGECKGNNGNGCFMDSCGHDCGCFTIQERSYSEEEVYHILCEHTAFLFAGGKSTLTEWFEQFKNK